MAPPPGYVAYGPGNAGAFGATQPIGGVVKWLQVLVGVSIAMSALSLIVLVSLRSKAQDFVNGDINLGRFEDSLGLFVTASLLVAAASIALLVLQCIWSYRIASNLLALGRQPLTFKPGLTVAINILGGCTLYIANFFMLREQWLGSDPTTPRGDQGWKQRALAPIIPIWLGLALLGTIGGAIYGVGSGLGSFRQRTSKDLAEQLNDQLTFSVVSGLLGLASTIVFLLIIRQLSARHMQATGERSG
jgi:Domain of unknown function (DUF4328)